MGGLSTRHVVLGLLVERPGYGYDLQQRIDARLGFLGLSENAVYKILERLEREGWIEEMGRKEIGATRRGAATRHVPRDRARARALQAVDVDALRARACCATSCRRSSTSPTPATCPSCWRPPRRRDASASPSWRRCSGPCWPSAAAPNVPWQDAATLMVDDFRLRCAADARRLARRDLRR